MTRALYPGTFDPIHNGHIDIATRASALFGEVIVAVYDAPPKKLLFTTEERMALAQEALAHIPNVSVVAYTGLTVNYAREIETNVIVRGLRAVSDFEYEFQMAGMNRYLLPDVETLFLTPSDQYQFVSGSIVREIAQLGGDVSPFVAPSVAQRLARRVVDQQAK